MKEKIKRAAILFIYRSVICVCLFGISVTLNRIFPSLWEKCRIALYTHTDLNNAGILLKDLFYEIAPFFKS